MLIGSVIKKKKIFTWGEQLQPTLKRSEPANRCVVPSTKKAREAREGKTSRQLSNSEKWVSVLLTSAKMKDIG